ncbi:MAG TPA: outer membrane beta-barrel protein [Legionella sp.]|nr:outer membrane beta-barrel protein [Legionella sp.]
MKQLIRLSILSGILFNQSAMALNPVQGFYVGLLGTISHGPSSDEIMVRPNPFGTKVIGTVDYSSVSGGGGGVLGYKYSHFRVEGEIFYNSISTGPLTVGSCTLESSNILTPTGVCPRPEYETFVSQALGYNGKSNALYGLVNAYWDFFSYEGETMVVPYLGAGIGQARIRNTNNFTNTYTFNSKEYTESNTSGAYQGIVGLSYYMDDYAWIGMDYRYLSTKALPEFQDRRYALHTLNFNVNFAFDKGGIY